jgi:hypothetical protein
MSVKLLFTKLLPTANATKTYLCPVPACVSVAGSKALLQLHFLKQRPQDLVCCLVEGSLPLPQCDRCGLQITYAAINDQHYKTAMYRGGVARKGQHAAAECVHLALCQTFIVYSKELERVEVFKHLVRLLAYNDNDTRAVRGNLKKVQVQGTWAGLSRTIRANNASPCVCKVFYKATVQLILLF